MADLQGFLRFLGLQLISLPLLTLIFTFTIEKYELATNLLTLAAGITFAIETWCGMWMPEEKGWTSVIMATMIWVNFLFPGFILLMIFFGQVVGDVAYVSAIILNCVDGVLGITCFILGQYQPKTSSEKDTYQSMGYTRI